MTEFEILNHSHTALRNMLAGMPDPAVREHLEAVRRGLWDLTKAAERRGGTPIVFAMDMPGFVTIGRKGCEVTYRHPEIGGLVDAWRILLAGLTVTETLHAADLVGDVRRPGNALRNRLATAADWIEQEAMCPELAQALRRPSIVVTDDGRIRHAPTKHLVLELFTLYA